ncbi:lysophospholipid acyltransferase family protein [Luteolibacter marinus]|uniref:lysophospholipid acyltransferase family protein n=1 Tax=Luteolibacter marinus TaxID=2776705 RepID=UPI001868C4BD|nr:lysophospholipid acyltransferase family protein [Luteolibacter marinus]
MSDPEPQARRATPVHRLQYALFRGVEALLGLFPITPVVQAGRLLGHAAWRLSPKHRRLVTRNLRIATAASPPGEAALREMVKETFRRSGGNLLGGQRAATMKPAELRRHITFEGMEHVREPILAGRGVVVVWSHMGNWEALAQLLPELDVGARGGPIYRPLENPLLDQLTLDRRTQHGAVIFSKHDGFNGPAALLREGGAVTVMSDQRAGGHGALCPFFGRLSSCTPLPSLLARRTGAAVVALSISSGSTGHWKLKIRPVPAKANTAEIMTGLEDAMRDSLTDVFWFHDRWRVDKERPLSFFTKEMPTEAARAAAVPTRFVATLPANSPEALETLTAILEMRPDVRIDILDPGGLPRLPDDPRLVAFPWDPSAPAEQVAGVLDRCDASHPAPLDFALLLDGDVRLARAAARLGLRSIIGTGVKGKPWTRSFPTPTHAGEWRDIAAGLIKIKKTRDS